MKFNETGLADLIELEMRPIKDERGSFSTLFCEEEFIKNKLESIFLQVNLSYNYDRLTLRGLHYQAAPYQEVKIVRCTKGSIWDVVIDLRTTSSTYGKYHALVLSEDNQKALYIPKDFAHGYLTLTDDAEVLYIMSELYHPSHERGYKWDDKILNIAWPEKPKIISERDQRHPEFKYE